MPSDPRTELALKALAGDIRAFRSAMATTIEQMRGFRESHDSAKDGRVAHLAAELGPFAAGRIDVDRFAGVFHDAVKLDRVTLETIDKAVATLGDLSSRGERLFVTDVESGASLRDAVESALADVGRAFGATRVFETARYGRFPANDHARSLGSFPFSRWSSAERRLGPPLVVEVDGADVRAASLADYMDGTQKIVLVVRGESTPVPLVRLITPGTFVLQSVDGLELDRLAAWDGPGIAALVTDTAARFAHDPGADERLHIGFAPDGARRKAIGGVSLAQQEEEIRQLRSLGAQAGPGGETGRAPATVGASSDPVDKLAAWLLTQADLRDVE